MAGQAQPAAQPSSRSLERLAIVPFWVCRLLADPPDGLVIGAFRPDRIMGVPVVVHPGCGCGCPRCCCGFLVRVLKTDTVDPGGAQAQNE
jgi:hypothetical protein